MDVNNGAERHYFNSRINGRVHSQHLGVLLRQDIVEADVAFNLRLVVYELEDGHFGRRYWLK